MKPIFHKLGMLVAMLLAFLPASAYDFEVDWICYNINDDGETVSVTYKIFSRENYSYAGDFSIPSTVTYNETSYTVTSIGHHAFYNCHGMTNIDIPNSVISIEYSAFTDCTELKSIEIPSSVTSIGDGAFIGCTDLKSIAIPSSVTALGALMFWDCTSLTSIEIPSSVTSIESSMFWNCTSLTSIKIPSSVTSIGYCAFKECTSLKSIEIPSSVTVIDLNAFDGCTSLASIEMPSSVTEIRSLTFNGCTSLTSIVIPNSVTNIGFHAFLDCTGLAEIYSYADTPPVCGNKAFEGVDKQKCILYVPKASVDKYRAADEWKDFSLIEDVESGIEDVISDTANEVYEVYNLNGARVMTTTDKADFHNLATGIYVINGRKYVIR